jgi:hypothetical protein
MDAIDATIAEPIEINTAGGARLGLIAGQYRITPDKHGGAELVPIQGPASPIRLTPMQWGVLDAARFIERR